MPFRPHVATSTIFHTWTNAYRPVNFELTFNSFHIGYWIWNIICKIAATLLRPHCVKFWPVINSRQIAVSSPFSCDVKHIDCHPPNDTIACNHHYFTSHEPQLTGTSSTSCIIQYTHSRDLLVAKLTSLFQQSSFLCCMSCISFFSQIMWFLQKRLRTGAFRLIFVSAASTSLSEWWIDKQEKHICALV